MKQIAAILVLALLLSGCAGQSAPRESASYREVTAEQAKQIMDTETGYVILDVREQEEFDEKHIPGAVLLPLGDVESKAKTVLPDPAQRILIYCRSGRRSKLAAQSLVQLGYTNVVEFGGILDWPYETE